MIYQVLNLHCLKCKSWQYLKINEKLSWFDDLILVLEDVCYHVMLFCLSLYTHIYKHAY